MACSWNSDLLALKDIACKLSRVHFSTMNTSVAGSQIAGTSRVATTRSAVPPRLVQASPQLLQQGRILCSVAKVWSSQRSSSLSSVSDSLSIACPSAETEKKQTVLQQLQGQPLQTVAFFAASTLVASEREVYAALAKAVDVYQLFLTLRVLLTWFRNINWNSSPFNILRQFTDPYLQLFRGIVPPIGGIDLSVLLGFFLLSFVGNQLRRMAVLGSFGF